MCVDVILLFILLQRFLFDMEHQTLYEPLLYITHCTLKDDELHMLTDYLCHVKIFSCILYQHIWGANLAEV